MTLQASGPISYFQIINEFGGNRGSLGNYRVIQSVGGVNWPLDEGVPTSGQISFSNFYSKSKNIIVDCYSAGGTRVDAERDRGRTVVGGGNGTFTGARVVIYVNSTFTTTTGGPTNKCALRTGAFSAASKMDVILGNSAQIYGGGGAGGNGGNAGGRTANVGNAGQTGTSALGLQRYVESVVLSPFSLIRAGAGGGGGGGGGAGEIRNSQEYGAGGGGSGGSGIPAGPGGSRGNDAEREDREASNGNSGSTINGGGGGLGATGGQSENKADGGGGGGGGSWGGSGGNGGESGNGTGQANDGNPGGTNGTGGSGGKGGAEGTGQVEAQGGAGGASGYAIASNSNIGFLGGGTIQGPIGLIGVS